MVAITTKQNKLFDELVLAKQNLISECCNSLSIEVSFNYANVNTLWLHESTSMEKIKELEKLFWYFGIARQHEDIRMYNIKDFGIKILY